MCELLRVVCGLVVFRCVCVVMVWCVVVRCSCVVFCGVACGVVC